MNHSIYFLKIKFENIVKFLFTFSMSIFICSIVTANEPNAINSFEQGCEAYKKNDIQNAIKLFNAAAEKYESAELYYNLGNCNFKLNKLPEAILNYERALKLAPGDEDVDYNLKLANGQIVDKIDSLPTLEIEKWWDHFKYGKGANYWGWLSIVFISIGLILIVFFKISNSVFVKRFGFYLGFVFIILSGFSLYFAYQNSAYHSNASAAIIFASKVDVKSSPLDEGTNVFVLHEGTKVVIVSGDKDWLEIKIANGNRGWIMKKNCLVI